MKIATVLGILLIALFASFAQAADGEVPYDHEVYLHPFSLILGTAVEALPTMFHVTYERPISSGSAIIVAPNVTFGSIIIDDIKIFGLGTNAGFRKYLAKPASGIYLQVDGAVDYASLSESSFGTKVTANTFALGVLGFIGVKGQFDNIGLFGDFGLGYQFGSVSTAGGAFTQDVEGSIIGLALDINIGLGYAF